MLFRSCIFQFFWIPAFRFRQCVKFVVKYSSCIILFLYRPKHFQIRCCSQNTRAIARICSCLEKIISSNDTACVTFPNCFTSHVKRAWSLLKKHWIKLEYWKWNLKIENKTWILAGLNAIDNWLSNLTYLIISCCWLTRNLDMKIT